MVKKGKTKYFTTENLVRLLGAFALFIIVKTYNRIDKIGDKIVSNETRISIIEYIVGIKKKGD